jgi:uncharacterized repeat protein (TIGR03847 family)
MASSFELPDVERITVGTVGPPGQRTFYLQARMGAQLVTLKMEKQQVAALAQFLGTLLADLPRPGEPPTDLDLEEPAIEEWAVGSMQLSYDSDLDRIVMIAEEAIFTEDEDESSETPAIARFAATREQMAAVAIRGTSLVEAGRPPCPLCGFPLDPSGHACPRTNGHRPPTR